MAHQLSMVNEVKLGQGEVSEPPLHVFSVDAGIYDTVV